MNYISQEMTIEKEIIIENYLHHVGIDKVRQEIYNGLQMEPKRISPKYFYDEYGSELFEKITHLEEYYPTRTEYSILSTIYKELNINLSNTSIVELGSGDASKITLFLNQIPQEVLATIDYYPVDISGSAIKKATDLLRKKFPVLRIRGYVLDIFHQLEIIPFDKPRIFCFFGSTIGNMTPKEIKTFLQMLNKTMKKGDRLLLGMDMIKDIHILEAAYNDADGITAEFNKNILNVINRLANTNFNKEDFSHYTFYNRQMNRIEMHLKAMEDMEIYSPFFNPIILKKGEMIHTENSHKFSRTSIDEMTEWAELSLVKVLTDQNDYFSIALMEKQ